ncbi:MAG: agmatinase [Melioribacteraceae bacterium]|nr:agmatinase [Melioribacteraceae bacterium]MCF8265975.1 agmatinase [Melioribacteraceae bacterium]
MKVLGEKRNFLAVEENYSSYENSEIVIISAPLEATVSYGGGTKNGPKEILKASHYVEFYDEEFDRELIFETGICTLPELDFNGKNVKKSIELIYKETKKHLQNDKFVVVLGGEHSLSQATIKAHFEHFSNISVLQIDAHSDFRDSYEGSKYSHASVMARVAEFTKDIVQVGIRAQCIEESEFIKENQINTFYARDIRTNKYEDWQSEAVQALHENVYITFDVDGLDPSVISDTGTPEPGGLFWDETIDLIKKVGAERRIVGFDVVELAPKKGATISSFNTAKIIYKILNCAFK